MRKILLAVFLLASTLASAQIITIDEVRNGNRSVVTDKIVCKSFTDKVVLSVYLWASIDEERNDTTLLLGTELASMTRLMSDREAVMLLKLMDDSVVEMKSIDLTATDSESRLHFLPGAVIRTENHNLAFIVDKALLERIGKLGVKKVRIATQPEIYDKEFKKDKVGEAVRRLWRFLRVAIKTPNQSKSIYDGF